jgi:hypothetical protein
VGRVKVIGGWVAGVGAALVPSIPLSQTSCQYLSINCALVWPIPNLTPKITCVLLIITSLVVRVSVSCASVSAWPLKAYAIEGGAGVGGIGWAFLAACVAYMMPPLHMVERVLIWQAGVSQLVELAVEVGQVILVLVLSCVSEMTISSKG